MQQISIWMISEGSLSNDAVNLALHHMNNYILEIFSNKKLIFNFNNILQYYHLLCILDQINAAFVSIKGHLWKNVKNLTDTKHLNRCNVFVYEHTRTNTYSMHIYFLYIDLKRRSSSLWLQI